MFQNALDADALFCDPVLQALNQHNFDPVMPPVLKASRSIILKKCDLIVYDNSTKVIQEEVEKNNAWPKVREAFKFENSRTIKIVFTNAVMSKLCLEDSIFMFDLFIPGM